MSFREIVRCGFGHSDAENDDDENECDRDEDSMNCYNTKIVVDDSHGGSLVIREFDEFDWKS